MSNLNHMICPHCGHDFYTNAAYGTCDACQCCFYAEQSRTCNKTKLPDNLLPEGAARALEEAKWWEHLAHADHDVAVQNDEKCIYCARIAELSRLAGKEGA